MLKRFISYYKPHRALFYADLIASLILSACSLVYPMITRKMINEYIPEKNIRSLVMWAVILIFIYLAKMFLNYFVAYYGHLVGVRIQSDMRRDIFTHLQTLPMKYFDDAKTGTIMSRIVNDLQEISELAHHGPEDVFISIVMLIGSFVIMAKIYLPLTLILFAGIPIMIIFSGKQRRNMRAAFKESRKRIGEINADLENSISGIRVSKAFTNDEFEKEKFKKSNINFVNARTKAYKAMGVFHSGNEFIIDFLMVVMYVAGGLFFMFGKIEIADFTAFILYISIFTNPIRRLINFTEMFNDGMTGFGRFCEIIDTEPENENKDGIKLEKAEGKICFENVTFAYGEKSEVLSDLSFTVDAGKTLALVGQSGGGKTTICNLIPKFYEVEKGRITLDGTDIKDIELASLRRQIGIVSQDVFLFDATVFENIAYGRPDAAREEVIEASKLANIHEFIMSLPDGYETEVGERGIKLSGGQKQRISIARVFLKNPPILILDEATSALDNATEIMIQQSLEQLSHGRTVLVVAHRLTTVKNADEILVVTKNGIEERGTHSELLCANGTYASLWNMSVGE